MSMLIVHLKKRKEMPILGGHPWIYSGAIDGVNGVPEAGSICRVLDSKGRFVCQGFYNPYSQVSIRVLSFEKDSIDRSFFMKRIRKAIDMRKRVVPDNTNCYRLINAEGDRIPGLFVDLYNTVIVMQFLCPGIERHKDTIVDIFRSIYPGYLIHERSDDKSRSPEGLKPYSRPLYGRLPEGEVETVEHGIRFLVDVRTGDRTGFYIDHRNNRKRIAEIAKDKRVLDIFSFTGGFSISALSGGAKSAISVDSSAPALDILKRNMELNRISTFSCRCIKEDALSFLTQDRDMYEIVVCDPPPLPREPDRLTRLYSLAMARVRPGGILMATLSYPYTLPPEDIIRHINDASRDASREIKIIERLCQSSDYPYLPSHPQGIHLSGYMVYVA